MSRFKEYYKEVVRPLLFLQYNILKSSAVPEVTFVRVGFSFTNLSGEEDWRLLKSFKLLSTITGKRPSVGDVFWSASGGRERRLVGSCFVTLRADEAYNFLEYLVHVVLPLNSRRYGLLDAAVSNTGVCNFVLKDLGVFFRQTEDLVGFHAKAEISIGTSTNNREECASLLRGLGLSV